MENSLNTLWNKSSIKVPDYQIALLDWYNLNKRDLPWRDQPSLYKTVVSEFMLQQTRVTTVLPYFQNWLNEFPNFKALSVATEAKVLKAWEGLGYYSRARNLHKLSKIATNWKTPPLSIGEWNCLPGVGPYIAAAVTSISLGLPQAVCDGNVVRVLSRVFAIKEIFKDGASAQKKIRPLAQSLIYSSKPGDYNQAMMELGAMICHRSNPLCSICPIFTYCKSGKTDSWTKYPAIAAKPKRSTLIQRYWVEAEGQLLLHASSKNRLQGIFELPQELPVHSDISKSKTKILAIRKRTIGNVLYTEQILKIGIASYFKNSLPQGYAWVKWSEIEAVTLSGPHRRWIKEIKKIND